MKNLKIVVLMLAFVALLTTPSYAVLRKDRDVVRGKVVYVNSSRSEITVKDPSTGKEMIFTGKPVDQNITTGSDVIVMYKKGTTTATFIRLVQKKGPRAATATASATATTPAKKSWY